MMSALSLKRSLVGDSQNKSWKAYSTMHRREVLDQKKGTIKANVRTSEERMNILYT